MKRRQNQFYESVNVVHGPAIETGQLAFPAHIWIDSQESGSRLVGPQTRWHRHCKLSQDTSQISMGQLYALGQTRRPRAVAEHGRLLAPLWSKRNGNDHISGVLCRNQQIRVAEERGIDGSWTIDVKAG